MGFTFAHMKFKEMIKRMESGEPFHLEWVSCSVRRKTGGAIKSMGGLRKEPGHGGGRAGKKAGNAPAGPAPPCQHVTLCHQASGRYLRVYKRLVIRFDGEEVTFG